MTSRSEHYREAERLLAEAATYAISYPKRARAFAALAQVHATLATVERVVDVVPVVTEDRGLWCPVHRSYHPSPVCDSDPPVNLRTASAEEINEVLAKRGWRLAFALGPRDRTRVMVATQELLDPTPVSAEEEAQNKLRNRYLSRYLAEEERIRNEDSPVCDPNPLTQAMQAIQLVQETLADGSTPEDHRGHGCSVDPNLTENPAARKLAAYITGGGGAAGGGSGASGGSAQEGISEGGGGGSAKAFDDLMAPYEHRTGDDD